MKAFGSGLSFVGSFLVPDSISLLVTDIFIFLIIFLSQLCVSLNLSILYLGYLIFGTQLFIVFSCNPFYFYRVGNNVLSFKKQVLVLLILSIVS